MSREIQVRICGGPGGEIPLGYSTIIIFIMVFKENLGKWCKWGTRMDLKEWKGPIF